MVALNKIFLKHSGKFIVIFSSSLFFNFITINSWFITEGLTVSASSSSTTSIRVSWELQNTLTASGYTISYINTNNTQCFTDSMTIPDISASVTSQSVDNLEEGTQYSITLTATLTGVETLQGSDTAATLTASAFSVLFSIT